MTTNVNSFLKKVWEGALDMVLPPACPICGKPVGAGGKEIAGGKDGTGGKDIAGRKEIAEGVCARCRGRVSYICEPICLKCGKPIASENKEYCADCETLNHVFDRSVAVYEYSDSIKDSIYRFKYYNKREYAVCYGNEMARNCMAYLRQWKPDVIIPVPIHESKLKSRKFNQAELIAKSLSVKTGIPMDCDILFRVKKTSPMKELNNESRRKNLQNAFQVSRKVVRYKKVLVVDDIYTTGATLDACAKILKESGVVEVYGITLCVGDGF